MPIKSLSRIVMIILWFVTLVCALLWAFGVPLPIEPEPITVILGLVSAAVTALVNEYSNALEQEEYTVSYALAYGYVINFLEPVITAILKKAEPGKRPKFYIYLPEQLKELEAKSIDRTLARLREKNLITQSINLDLSEGRVRDVLAISMDTSNEVYFDFPTTLLTLNSFIIYKSESKKNSFGEEEKVKMGKAFIDKFQSTVASMLVEKNLSDYVSFVGRDLTFN